MAGSLQARAVIQSATGGVDVEPDACPMAGHGAGSMRACSRSWAGQGNTLCAYLYGFTEGTDPTERITEADMELWMKGRAMHNKRVRVLCLQARSVDRAGS